MRARARGREGVREGLGVALAALEDGRLVRVVLDENGVGRSPRSGGVRVVQRGAELVGAGRGEQAFFIKRDVKNVVGGSFGSAALELPFVGEIAVARRFCLDGGPAPTLGGAPARMKRRLENFYVFHRYLESSTPRPSIECTQIALR